MTRTPIETLSIMLRLPGLTVDDWLKIGWKLLELRESVEHGEFTPALERLGLDRTAASRLIRSARFFSHLPQVRKHVPSKSMMFELLPLDDVQLDELERTGCTGGLKLKDIPRLTVNELRHAVRSVREGVVPIHWFSRSS